MSGSSVGAPASSGSAKASPRQLLVSVVVAALAVAAAVGTSVRGPALTDEYVYLATARYFADTGSLDARSYNYTAILSQGYPHQDMHAPGYALLLGAWMRLFPFGYAAAVALNAVACIALAPLALVLARRLGLDGTVVAALAAVALPGYLPYVTWVMPEVLVGAFFMATLALAAGAGQRSAIAAGALWTLSLLVRESAVFVLPAILALTWRRRRMPAFLATAALTFVLIYMPLSKNRGEGGTNFWRETSENSAFQFSAVLSVLEGDLEGALAPITGRARQNLDVFRRLFSPVELGMLALLGLLPVLSALRWRRIAREPREYTAALALGAAALAASMVALFIVPPWSGIRYAMALGPPFVVLLGRRVLPAVVLIVSLGLNVAAQQIFDAYKQSRERRQEGLTEYVDRYVPPGQTRIVMHNGYHYGWKHYPVEVIASVPEDETSLRLLANALTFDYLVLPAESELKRPLEKRARYELLNGDDPEPLALIYRRLR